MKDRAEEIKRRHQERKKQRLHSDYLKNRPTYFQQQETRDDEVPVYLKDPDDDRINQGHPLASKQRFILRVMVAAALFLGVGILFKNPTPAFDGARAFVKDTFHHEFQFALVSDWYKKKFGEPLALFPKPNDSKDEMKAGQANPGYAMPVSGTATTVTKTFTDTGKGIMVETGTSKAVVEAVKQGFVTSVGEKPGLGKTVVIQLPDGSEAWYGKLAKVDVKLYDTVEAKEKVGTVTAAKNGKSGTFFFALKKGDSFVNPLKVIHFE